MPDPSPTPLPLPGTAPAPVPQEQADERLPVDVRTLLVGIRRRVPLAVAIAILATVVGIVCGLHFGERVFTATTVLLYRPPAGASADSAGNEAPSLRTQVDLVKIPSNLEEVRRRLTLAARTEQIGNAIDITVPENTSLLTITATWNDAAGAATLANTLRDVFLENQRTIARAEAQSKMTDLEGRLARVVEQQRQADTALKEYATTHGVVDLDKEAQWYLEQLISTELLHEQAIGEKQAVDLQQANLSQVVAELKQKITDEERTLESLSTPGASRDTASAAGDTDEGLHGRLALVELRRRELERAEKLREQGLISRSQEDQMRAALEAERYAVFNNSPTAGLLKEMLVRELNIKLDTISAERKVSQLGEAVARVKDKLKQLPVVQREYVMLQREVEAREAERSRLEQLVAGERRKVESEAFGFNLVSEAKPPTAPIRSSRRMLALAIAAAGTLAGVVLIVLLEIADTRLKSPAETDLKLGVPVLAALPAGDPTGDALGQEPFLEAYQAVRRRWPRPGVRLMVTSAVPGGQSWSVALELARVVANHESSVLLIDAETRRLGRLRPGADPRPASRHRVLRSLDAASRRASAWWMRWSRPGAPSSALSRTPPAGGGPGLRDYLTGALPDWRAAVRAEASGVSCIQRGGDLASAQLASLRMQEFVRAASREFDFVILHTTAVTPLADAGFLARYVDGVVLEIASPLSSADSGRRALQRLSAASAPVAGIVLTGIDPAYLEGSWA